MIISLLLIKFQSSYFQSSICLSFKETCTRIIRELLTTKPLFDFILSIKTFENQAGAILILDKEKKELKKKIDNLEEEKPEYVSGGW